MEDPNGDYIFKLLIFAFVVKVFKELIKDEKARSNFMRNLTKIAKFIAKHPKTCILYPTVAYAGYQAWKGLGWQAGLGGAISALVALEIATRSTSEVAGTAALAYLAGIGIYVGLWPAVSEGLKPYLENIILPPSLPLSIPLRIWGLI